MEFSDELLGSPAGMYLMFHFDHFSMLFYYSFVFLEEAHLFMFSQIQVQQLLPLRMPSSNFAPKDL